VRILTKKTVAALLTASVVCIASLLMVPGVGGGSLAVDHTAVGSTQWFVAEGSTGGGFDTYILVVNPNNQKADIDVIFSNEKGPVFKKSLTLQPLTRKTLKVSDYVGSQWHISTIVRSTSPVVVERSMYWDKRVKSSPSEMKGGHSNLGVPLEVLKAKLLTTLYLKKNRELFSEGTTIGGFDTWLLIVNPNSQDVSAKVEFLGAGGVITEKTVVVSALARKTIHLEKYISDTAEIATRITSSLPLIAERSTYWDKDASHLQPHQMEGGSTTSSAVAPSTSWYFAEGSTDVGFETYLLVENPQDKAASIALTFCDGDGKKTEATRTVNANTRSTFKMSDYVDGQDFGVRLVSDVPIVAERSTYWDVTEVNSLWETIEGNSSMGSPGTHKTWVVPEGSTTAGFYPVVAIANFGDTKADITARFLDETGVSKTATISVPAHSRYTMSVDDNIGEESSVSVLLDSSSSQVAVDRSMYWDKRHLDYTYEMPGGNSTNGYGSDK
jgi:hypothetical protein